MLAAVFEGVDKVVVREAPVPEIGADELLLRVRAATVCGSDLKIVAGLKTRGVRVPSILGHEIAGEIVAVGDSISTWKCGSLVAVAPVIACGSCSYCRQESGNLCARRRALGYEYDGGFAQYLRVPAAAVDAGNVFPIPAGVRPEAAALSEPLSCCINGHENMGRIQPGETILIVGAGPIGIMHLQLAKAVAETRVIVSEPMALRRQFARDFGADIALDPHHTSLYDCIMEATGGLGVDKLILAVGLADLVKDLLALVRKNGAINLFAGFPAGAEAALDINEIHYRQIHISGASASTTAQFERALGMIASGDIDAQALISARYPLEQFRSALEAARQQHGLKTAILP
jgi:L-iditol 2-dehydrogenase